MLICGLTVAEHKDVPICGVAMHIAIQENVARVQSAFHHLLDVMIYGVLLLELFEAALDPLSVQISAFQ